MTIKINKYASQELKAGDFLYMNFGTQKFSELSTELGGKRMVIVLQDKPADSPIDMLLVIKCTRTAFMCSNNLHLEDVEGMSDCDAKLDQYGYFSKERIISKVKGNIGVENLNNIKYKLKSKFE